MNLDSYNLPLVCSSLCCACWVALCIEVNALVVINEVTLRRARLALGWITVYGRVNRFGI